MCSPGSVVMALTLCLMLKGVKSPDRVCTTNQVKAEACRAMGASGEVQYLLLLYLANANPPVPKCPSA